MTPELYAKLEKAIKHGEKTIKPYVGVDFILDEGETVYFVHVLINRNSHEVYAHEVKRAEPYNSQWILIDNNSQIAISAHDKAIK